MQIKRYIPCFLLLFVLGSLYITSCNSQTESVKTSKKTKASENLISAEPAESTPAETVLAETAPADSDEEGKKSAKAYPDNAFQEMSYGYMQPAKHSGRIETFTYHTKDYTGSGNRYQKSAKVYLPYAYDPREQTQQYDVLYLLHGRGENEEWYFGTGEQPSYLQILLDNMIENGKMRPCIVCTPTWQNPYCDEEAECTKYFPEELTEDLIPALEAQYPTYYETGEEEAAKQSRWHRAFGGLGDGAGAVWWALATSLKEIGYFMPISKESPCTGKNAENTELSGVKYLEYAVHEQEMEADDFLVYSACGGKEDRAGKKMKSQQAEIEKEGKIFRFCDNFSKGNFYHEVWKDGACDLNMVCRVLYNGLPKFFGLAQEEYLDWAEGAMQSRENKSLIKKTAYAAYGKWEKKTYYSRTAGRKTSVNVLLPAGYQKNKSYPVLYLLHGYWATEDWLASEEIGVQKIVGNLIDQGKAEQMIVVVPYIYCSSTQKKCSATDWDNSMAYDNFIHDLMTDLKPFIEEKYPVKKGRDNTAITGFSMGGREALRIGFAHPALFGYIGAACPASGIFPETDLSLYEDQLPKEDMVFEKGTEPHLLYITGGEADRTVGKYPEEAHNRLLDNQVVHLWNELPGMGHEKESLQAHLAGFLQTLFKVY